MQPDLSTLGRAVAASLAAGSVDLMRASQPLVHMKSPAFMTVMLSSGD